VRLLLLYSNGTGFVVLSIKTLFGQRLVHFRIKRGMTQEELAFRIGIHVMTLRRWEHGNLGPKTLDFVEKAAQVLEVEPWKFFTETDSTQEPSST
jgi:transcriptional regulator with XRE-family HTH domain